MRIDDAFRIARRAGRVADRRGAALVERRPFEAGGVDAFEQRLVAMNVGDDGLYARDVGHAVWRRHHNHMLDGRESIRDPFEKGQGERIDEQHAVFRMIDDIDDLIGKQARIDRVQDGADTGRGIEHLEMPDGVPRQRADTVALDDAEALQCKRHAFRAVVHLRIIGAQQIAFDLAADDFRVAMPVRRILNEAAQQERHVHH